MSTEETWLGDQDKTAQWPTTAPSGPGTSHDDHTAPQGIGPEGIGPQGTGPLGVGQPVETPSWATPAGDAGAGEPAPTPGGAPATEGAPGEPAPGQTPYGQAPSDQPPYWQPPYGQAPYGQAPYGQPPYGQPPYGEPPFGGQPPYGQPPYGQPPYGAPQGRSRGSKALRSAAAVLVIAAAALAGAGVSHAIFPAHSVRAAAGQTTPTTTPNLGGGLGGSGNGVFPFGGSGGSFPFGTGGTGSGGNSEGAGGPSDVSAIASKVDPALVDVNVDFNYEDSAGAGTGIVLTSNGLILTNNHVIDQATKISVTDVGNGKTYPATVVGYDKTHDVALLKLQGASGLKTAKIAASGAAVGEAVVAIGNAGGTGGTPTSAGGSITALDQSITASDELTQSSEQLSGLIETNANIEAGDSGGPLVNASGKVVGMDTAAGQNFSFSAEGNQGYAIPINKALAIAKSIEASHGTSTIHVGATAFIGVSISPNSGFGFGPGNGFFGQNPSTVNGLTVTSVVGGAPAQKAGIAAGDVVTKFDGHAITTDGQLTSLLVPKHPGQKATITWVTPQGASHTATITLASGPPA